MAAHTQAPEGPDFSAGIGIEAIDDGMILRGHVRGTPALAVRRGDALHIVGAKCSHYGLPLENGLVVEGELHCPFHHARFCLKSGAALGAPALQAIDSWDVEVRDGIVKARDKRLAESPISLTKHPSSTQQPLRFVIVGGGAAGNAAAEMMRAEGHTGSITMLSADSDRPYDRPACSKALLTGSKKPDAAVLREADFYKKQKIDLHTASPVAAIDTKQKYVTTDDGQRFPYDALLIATGAEPRKLDVPGADHPNVHYLRTLNDARALIDVAREGRRAVVIGASFIGLETAAGLRMRGVEVDVVSPMPLPMEKLLGKPLSDKLRAIHEEHGVRFHVGNTAKAIYDDGVHLDDGTVLAADIIVVGIGVSPRIALAKAAGIVTSDGINVDALLRTNIPDVYAAGDVAQWPDPFDGTPLRIEHWVLAERQGQAVARTLLGRPQPFRQSPFFWSNQYDFSVGYIGHAAHWDRTESDGDLEKRDWSMTYFQDGQARAMAVVSRNLDGLQMEVELEQRMNATAAHSGVD